MHLKRQEAPKSWSIFRKGTKYVVTPEGFSPDKGVPLLIVLRDLLKVAQNRKEVKRAVHLRHVLINNRPASDERNSVVLFDSVTLVPSKKSYRAEIVGGGKFSFKEIKESEANQKITKLIDKKILKGKKVQLNCMDGRNIISSMKCQVGDSLVVNFKEGKIEKCDPIGDNVKVFVFSGKHAGKYGKVNSLDKEKGTAEVEMDGDKVNVLTKQIMAIQ